MKYPTASSAKGGGGTNMTRAAPSMGGCAHKGTMGTGESTMHAKNTMGSGSGNPQAKGVQGHG